ncbi:MAG: MFS transporter [bacterium]|nr:MFS transporter [bacterium]
MRLKLNRNLALLLGGQLVSQVGDKFYLLALSFWVLKTTSSPAKMGLVLACSLFPALLLGFVSGAFIDRFSRKMIIVGTDVLRGLIITFVAVAFTMGFLNFGIIIVSQLLLSVNAAFFDPAIPTIIPQIVAKDQLSRANSMTELIRGISTILGPVLGGIAVAGLGYGFAFFFNGASFLASAFFECFLKIPASEGMKEKAKTSIKKDIVAGYKYILGEKGLTSILIIVGVIHFFVGSIEVVIPVLGDILAGEGARNMGFMQAAFGIGALLSALLISFINIDGKELRLLFTGVCVVGLCYISITVLHLLGFAVVGPFLVVFAVTGSFIILAATCFKTILQKSIDEKMAGRVFGVVSSVGNGSIPFAMLLYGYLITYVDVYHLVLVTGLALVTVSVYYILKQGKPAVQAAGGAR